MRSPTDFLSEKTKNHSVFKMKSTKSEYFPPEFLLSRSDKISIDRKKQTKVVLDKNSVKDVSYLLDSISPRIENSPLLVSTRYPLPLELSELHILLESDTYSIENINKRAKNSRPYGRNDALNLNIWLEDMHKKYLSKLDFLMESQDFVDNDLCQIVETIYLVALKEVIKQLAVNCSERASTLFKIFEVLKYSWKKTPEDYSRIISTMNLKFKEELKLLKMKYKKRYETLLKSHKDVEKKLETSYRDNELLKNSQFILSQKIKESNDRQKKASSDKTVNKVAKDLTDAKVQTDLIKPKETRDNFSENDLSHETVLETDKEKIEEKKEKKEDQIDLLKKYLDLGQISESFIIEDLHKYVTTEHKDFSTWVDGFRLAIEAIQTKEKSQELEEECEQEDITIDQLNEKEIKEEVKVIENKRSLRGRRRTMKLTRQLTISKYITEYAPVETMINYLENQGKSKINKISKMSVKKLLNTIQYFINIARTKSFDQIQNFSLFIYTLLFQKYAMQQSIANKKFKDLIASCFKFSTETRVKIFLRMVGAGRSINLNKLMPLTYKTCFKVLDFMFNDKTGFMIDNPNLSDCVNFPFVRAVECTKQVLESLFTKKDVESLRKKIEEISFQDTNNLNKNGLVDIYEFLMLVIYFYENYSTKVYQGVRLSVEVLSGYNYVTWEEANVLIRTFNPKKQIGENDKAFLAVNQNNDIELEDFSAFCESKGILRIEDVHGFYDKSPPDYNEVIQTVQDLKENLEGILEKVQDKIVTLKYEEWAGKLDDIVVEMRTSKLERGNKLWMLFMNEYQYLITLNND